MTAWLILAIIALALACGGLLIWGLFQRQQVAELRAAQLASREQALRLATELEQARSQVAALQIHIREAAVRATTDGETDGQVAAALSAGLSARRERSRNFFDPEFGPGAAAAAPLLPGPDVPAGSGGDDSPDRPLP